MPFSGTVNFMADVCMKFPCSHIVHRSCAVSIILSALAESDNEGVAASKITCPFCDSDTLLFPTLQREPKDRTEQKQVAESRPKPTDITNLTEALAKCKVTEALSVNGYGNASCKASNSFMDGKTRRDVPTEELILAQKQRNCNQMMIN